MNSRMKGAFYDSPLKASFDHFLPLNRKFISNGISPNQSNCSNHKDNTYSELLHVSKQKPFPLKYQKLNRSTQTGYLLDRTKYQKQEIFKDVFGKPKGKYEVGNESRLESHNDIAILEKKRKGRTTFYKKIDPEKDKLNELILNAQMKGRMSKEGKDGTQIREMKMSEMKMSEKKMREMKMSEPSQANSTTEQQLDVEELHYEMVRHQQSCRQIVRN